MTPKLSLHSASIVQNAHTRLLEVIGTILLPHLTEIDQLKAKLDQETAAWDREKERRIAADANVATLLERVRVLEAELATAQNERNKPISDDQFINLEELPGDAVDEADVVVDVPVASYTLPEGYVISDDDKSIEYDAPTPAFMPIKEQPAEVKPEQDEQLHIGAIAHSFHEYMEIILSIPFMRPLVLSRAGKVILFVWTRASLPRLIKHMQDPSIPLSLIPVLEYDPGTQKCQLVGVVHPRERVPVDEVALGVPIPHGLDSTLWCVWKEHPFLNFNLPSGQLVRSLSFSGTTPFFNANSALFPALQAFSGVSGRNGPAYTEIYVQTVQTRPGCIEFSWPPCASGRARVSYDFLKQPHERINALTLRTAKRLIDLTQTPDFATTFDSLTIAPSPVRSRKRKRVKQNDDDDGDNVDSDPDY